MSEIGYVRVSTREQNSDLQKDAMANAGIDKVFADEGFSGTKASRPGLDEAISYMRSGDTLVVWKLDRLGRSTVNVISLINELAENGIGFRSLSEGLDTTGSYGKFMLTILAAFGEMERAVLVERTRIGLDSARSRGRVGGRKPSLSYSNKVTVMKMYRSQEFTIRDIAAHHAVSEPTVYRAIAEMKKNKK